jgi:PAS domain S-box-containing protein
MDADVSAVQQQGLIDHVFHGSVVGMVVARLSDGTVVEANEAFCSIVGRGLADVLGGNVDELGLWGELGPVQARAALTETGLIEGYDTTVTAPDREARIVRVWAERVGIGGERPDAIDDALVVIRASDVDGRTEAKARYRELREAEIRYRAMVEQLPAITYSIVDDPTSPTGSRDVYISPQIAQLGYTPREWKADPQLWVRAVHPEDRERVLGRERSAAKVRRRFHSEYRMIARDGRVVWIRDEAVFVEDPATGVRFWQGLMMDITAAKEAAELHAEAEAKYQNLVEQVPAIVYLAEYGDDGDWIYISPQVERVLGFTPEEWLAHPAPQGQLTHPDDLAMVRSLEEQSFATGEPFRAEYRMHRKDGRLVWILDEASVVRDEEGQPLFLQGLMQDITSRKESEERLLALDRLKNTLLHTLSHDLKEPLTAILGAASTLERLDRELAEDERRHLLRTLVDRTRGMNSLLTDLLDLERLDRGIIEPRRFPVDLGRLAGDIVARTPSLQGRVEIDDRRHIASVDAAKVERMVDNLLANAARHTPNGSRIWVRILPEDGGTTIAVEDEGHGVPEDVREAIFEPFRRGPDAGGQPGSGIGLSLVARFAELHGGRAWVQEREGGGASFRVFLPDVAAPNA